MELESTPLTPLRHTANVCVILPLLDPLPDHPDTGLPVRIYRLYYRSSVLTVVLTAFVECLNLMEARSHGLESEPRGRDNNLIPFLGWPHGRLDIY